MKTTKGHAAGVLWNVAANEDNKVTLVKLRAGRKLLKLLDDGTPDAKAPSHVSAGTSRRIRTFR